MHSAGSESSVLRRLRSLFPGARGSGVGSIGLDLGSEALHLVQWERSKGQTSLRGALSLPYPLDREQLLSSTQDLKALLESARRTRRFRGRRVVSALPSDQLKLMVLNYADDSRLSEPELILQLVQERVPQPLDHYVIDYLPIRKSEGNLKESSALVVIAREDAVLEYLELLNSAGLQVDALEIPASAIRRLVTWLAGSRNRHNSLVVTSDRNRSSLTVLWGRRLILCRELDFGEEIVIERISKSLHLSYDAARSMVYDYGIFTDSGMESHAHDVSRSMMEIVMPCFTAMAEEIGNALVYAASRTQGESVDCVYVAGALASWPGVEKLLNGLLSIPVRALDPLDGCSEVEGTSSSIALAAGLALSGLIDE